MLKKEHLQWILEKVNAKGIATVNDIIKEFDVSGVTVRRDLDELDKDGSFIRIHDGAQSIDSPKIRSKHEKSSTGKQEFQIEEKRVTVKFASQLVQEGEMILIGPETILEHSTSELVAKNIRVITSSLPVFNTLNENKNTDLILTGGEYRGIADAFIGSLTTDYLQNLRFLRAFVSANGTFGDSTATCNESEEEIQRITPNNVTETPLLVDHEKFDKHDFCDFYRINGISHLATDSAVTSDTRGGFGQLTDIIVAED